MDKFGTYASVEDIKNSNTYIPEWEEPSEIFLGKSPKDIFIEGLRRSDDVICQLLNGDNKGQDYGKD